MIEVSSLAALLMLVSVGLSAWLRLGLGRDILIASTRMVVQLLLVGLILGRVFRLGSPLPILAIGLVMTALAAQAAAGRPSRRYPGLLLDCFIAIFGSSFLLTGFALAGILRVRPWFEAQYAIPLLGMVLGNSLTSVALALDRFTTDLVTRRGEVETLLALGATRWEAAHPLIRTALRAGMMPTLNSMMVIGMVSLPGMMTGQILAGASPEHAVRYQIVVMFVHSASTALGCLGAVLLAFRALFDSRDRLRSERLTAKS